jgi:hypothetical protein
MKQRFTKVAVALLSVVTLGLVAGAAIPVPPAGLPVVEECQTRTVGNSGQVWVYWSWEMMGHTTGSFRVTSGCSHQIKFWSQGWRFEGTACGDMRVRLLTSSGNTLRRTNWTRVCGGPRASHTYTLASFLPTNQRFELEGRALDPGDRAPHLWWMGEFRF